MKTTNLILIKLGGSLITDKEKAYSLNRKNIEKIVKSLRRVIDEKKDTLFIVGNGAGSYGHYAATVQDYYTPFGFSFLQQKVKELNSIIVEEILSYKIPAVSIAFSSVSTAKNKELKSMYLDSLNGFLENGIVPVVYGDVIYDSVNNSTIFSTEKVFSILCDKLNSKYKISKVIHLTTVDGLLDAKNSVVPLINDKNFNSIKKNLSTTRGFDVTGGMVHKIEESMLLAKKGIDTHIINGEIDNVLESIILNGESVGTLVTSD